MWIHRYIDVYPHCVDNSFFVFNVFVGNFGLREAMRHALLLFISDSLKQSNK